MQFSKLVIFSQINIMSKKMRLNVPKLWFCPEMIAYGSSRSNKTNVSDQNHFRVLSSQKHISLMCQSDIVTLWGFHDKSGEIGTSFWRLFTTSRHVCDCLREYATSMWQLLNVNGEWVDLPEITCDSFSHFPAVFVEWNLTPRECSETCSNS